MNESNPYQPPSTKVAPNPKFRLLRPGVIVGCYLVAFSILGIAWSVYEAISKEQLRPLAPAGLVFVLGGMVYGVFKRDANARKLVIKFSRFMSVAIGLVGLAICLFSETRRMSVLWLTLEPTKTQLFGIVDVTVLFFAIPGLLLITPAAKREFSED